MTAKQATLSGALFFLLAASAGATTLQGPTTTQDGAYKIELADHITHDRFEIFSTTVATGVRRRISGPQPPGTPAEGWDCSSFVISSDGRSVIYRSGRAAFGDQILSSTPVDRQQAIRISGPAAGPVYNDYFAFAPKSVVYNAEVLVRGGPITTWIVGVDGQLLKQAIFIDGFESGGVTKWN